MWFTALLPLFSAIFGENGPLGQYFATKAKQVQADEELALAKIKADTDAIVSGNQATTDQTRDKLNATTQHFKQSTFYMLVVPMAFSIFFPKHAQILWSNFELIPVWYRTLFGAVYCTIWGIPLATGYIGGIFSGIGNVIQNNQDHKIEMAKINRDAVFAQVRAKWFPKGMSQSQTNDLDSALNAGETSSENN